MTQPCRHLSTESLVAASLEGRPRPTCSRCEPTARPSTAEDLRSLATAIRGGPSKPKAPETKPVAALNSIELENSVRAAFGLDPIPTDH